MSSSDSEELFFDALDITPSKEEINNVNQGEERTTEGEYALSEEERKFLEAKKIVEIRRKLEDEALEKRIREIHESKEKEKEEKLQHEKLEKDADINVKRRRKLEEMRQLMYAENTPDKPAKKTSHKEHTSISEDVIDQNQQACLNTGQTESVGVEIKDNLHNTQLEELFSKDLDPGMTNSDSSKHIKPQASSDNTGRRTKDDDFNSSHINKESVSQHSERTINDANVNTIGAVTEHLSQIELSDIKAPDLIQSVKSSSLGRNKSPVTVFIESNEENIVRAAGMASTSCEYEEQSKVLANADKDSKDMPPPPMVPPRRRKKVVSVGGLDQTCEILQDTSVKSKRSTTSPPNQLSVPSTSGCLLTAPSPQVARKTLDLNEAAMGNNLVIASEEEHTKAVNDITIAGRDTESIWDNESMIDSHGTSAVDSPQSTISNEEKVVTTENKSHSFPRSQQRPVSDISLTPTQMAILDDISVVNIDTGERIPISLAEEKIPQCINPLSLHIMRRTKEYLSDSSLSNQITQAEGEATKEELEEDSRSKTVTTLFKKKKKLKSLLGKAKNKLKSVKDEVFHNAESNSSSEDEDGERKMIQVKASKTNKGALDFDLIVPVQYMEGAHNGAVWTMKFSHCGRLLASGGTDNLLKVWVLKDAYSFFDDMRVKYSEEQKKRMSPAVSEDSTDDSSDQASEHEGSFQSKDEEWFSPFNRKPFCTYKGHTADILDVSWSKNYFILTSSMDKTVRLWHVSRKECLCCFQHIDFVTAIAFHPKDDRYFLSGSLDGKLRLWNIPDRKVELWNEVNGSTKLITATNFCMKGKFAVAGTYDGRCVFYSTEQLKYYTQIHVRSTRGKNSKGRKITGVEPMPGEDKILVTSNDSRIRIYDLRDLTLTCKYKGCVNNSSQIKAHFSHDGRFVVCGSEDHFVYIWRTQHEFHKFSSARRDRSDYWESIKAHNAVVTVALFAPKPNLVIKNQFEFLDSDDKQSTPEVRGEVLVSADYNGTIKCFINKFKPVNT